MAHLIEKYAFGRITVNGVAYSDDIKIINGKAVPGWWRKSGHRVCLDDIRDMLDFGPQILVIGSGKFGLLRLPSSLREFLKNSGITLMVEKTPEAVKIFNRLYAAGKNVSAGFHLTC